MCLTTSTAAHCDDDLEFVPVRQLPYGKLAAWHDLAVPFQCDTLAGQVHLFDERGDAGRIGKFSRCSIDADDYHFQNCAGLENCDAITRVPVNGRAKNQTSRWKRSATSMVSNTPENTTSMLCGAPSRPVPPTGWPDAFRMTSSVPPRICILDSTEFRNDCSAVYFD